MRQPLRILHLEDRQEDSDLIRSILSAEGIDCELSRVETREDFLAALAAGGFDLILADYNLPSFDGITALRLVKEKCLEVPFIFVSGFLGEEPAIETLKSGATDYVLKERLFRLVPSVRRALQEFQQKAELKILEEQVRQAQKMEAIGRLAAGVAHDFNNLLTAILGYCELLLGNQPSDSPMRSDLEEIKKAGERAVSLTRQLLIFSRRQVVAPLTMNLNAVVAQAEDMLRGVVGADIELVFNPGEGDTHVTMDPGQIEQMIMNLAVNACDAMQGGGSLTLETAVVDLDASYAFKHMDVAPGKYVMLAISDTGKGMSEETKSRIFEPFFTTKEAGKGAGLGLAIVYGLVKQSGGTIWVYSEPGKGTTFKIYFPQAQKTAGTEEVAKTTVEATDSPETILVVEDNREVRLLASRLLRIAGYSVLEALDGPEALSICEKHAQPIHLVMTDLVLPGMSGRDFINKLSAVRPAVRVLCMSGYTEDLVISRGMLDRGTAFVQKPFTPGTLLRKVREVLSHPRQPTR